MAVELHPVLPFFVTSANSLKNDLMVNICIQGKFEANATSKTLYAPRSLLESNGDNLKKWVQAAFATPVLVHGNVQLYISNSNYEAWQVFLCWILNREVPTQIHYNQELLIRSWGLGEEFLSFEFMGDVMFRLLRCYEKATVSVEAIRYAFCGTRIPVIEMSNLRTVIAEEVVRIGLLSGDGAIQQAGLYQCYAKHEKCGLEDLAKALQRVGTEFESKPYLMFDRFTGGEVEQEATCMEKLDGGKWREIRFWVRKRIKAMMKSG